MDSPLPLFCYHRKTIASSQIPFTPISQLSRYWVCDNWINASIAQQGTPVNCPDVLVWLDYLLGLFGEFFDDPCYPLASLDEHVDPLVLVRSVSIALGMVTTNSHCRQS